MQNQTPARFGLIWNKSEPGAFAVAQLPTRCSEAALAEEDPKLSPLSLCLCVQEHACGWTVEKVVDKWPGAVRCQIRSFMATEITAARKQERNYNEVLRKPSETGQI